MSQTASLAAVYAGPHVPDNPWWVRLEQIPVTDDVATVSETADLLDALYQVNPCTDNETAETDDELTAEDVASAASATLELAACGVASDGSVEVQIKVIRSHQTEAYRLHVAGGSVVETVVVQEEISQNIAVSGATEIILEYPVLGAFTASWQSDLVTTSGSTPIIKRVGNVLYWTDDATGTMQASFLTVYDLATIRVDGVDGEQGEALVRVVFHALAEEMTPDLPDPAEMDRSLCSGSARLITGNDRVTCYKAITVEQLCSCSKDLVDSYSYEQIVDCPEWVTSCPGGAQDCMALLGSETVKEYVECGGDNQVSGSSRIWAVSNADYYRKVCCEDPPNSLPQCYEKTTSYRGGQEIVNGRQFWRDLYGPLTRFTPVSPAGGICGKHITRQVVAQSNCCDGVEPLAWDTEISPEVMAPNSAAVIAVTGGGRYSYQWRVIGSGFQFSNGSKKITTNWPTARLSALPLACGTARIEVTDGCTIVAAYIRCTAGRWAPIGDGFWPDGEIDASSAGLFLCSSYGYPYQPGYKSILLGRWYVGSNVDTPPAISTWEYCRESHYLGLWASTGDASPVMVDAPGTGGEVRVAALVSQGIGACGKPDGGSAVDVYQYWFAPFLKVWEWIC
jgi:hypothetical protein